MKFGKLIQSSQIPGWGPYYLDYKFLKKIINSLADNRPASEAAKLAEGIRPSTLVPGGGQGALDAEEHPDGEVEVFPMDVEQQQHLVEEVNDADQMTYEDAPPLPPTSIPPTPGFSAHNGGSSSKSRNGGDYFDSDRISIRNGSLKGKGKEREETLRAHRTVFFFKLEREMEKINAFYLLRERSLHIRLLALLNNRKRLISTFGSAHQRGSRSSSSVVSDGMNGGDSGNGLGVGAEWKALEEGWRVFERDLGKLQQFIEINATGFRKILKKWDKRSKSNTKEMYLQRQVEVQPVFNREFIAKMSDIVASNLLDLESSTLPLSSDELPLSLSFSSTGATNPTLLSAPTPTQFDLSTPSLTDLSETIAYLETSLLQAIATEESAAILESFETARQDIGLLKETHSMHVLRILWKAISEVEDGDLVEKIISQAHGLFDFNFIDDINNRTPLHFSTLSKPLHPSSSTSAVSSTQLPEDHLAHATLAKLCVEIGRIDPDAQDAYGRTALHYSCLTGKAAVTQYLLSIGALVNKVDMDGFTPLLHAVVNGHLDCVQHVLDKNPAAVEGLTEVNSEDLLPLSLASQHGHLEVTRLLLQRGAKMLPNSEGLYPLHLAAREGHSEVCQLLVSETGGELQGGLNKKDKYNQWTPLFHASTTGDGAGLRECVKVLLEAGAEVNETDEYGKTPLFYAAYYGHVGSVGLLLKAGAAVPQARSTFSSVSNGTSTKKSKKDKKKSTFEAMDLNVMVNSLSPGSDFEELDLDDPELDVGVDGDIIPSLLLPPPILPVRTYGHSYLNNKVLIQLSLGHPFSRTASRSPVPVPAVKLYGSEEGNHLHMWSSLKLVMASKPDITSIPHSVILPLADEQEVFTFQIDERSLDQFSLEFSLYPTFGSRVIGRAVLLPDSLRAIISHKAFVAPLFDHQLTTIGEVSFELSVVKPFGGVQLEIGGRVETYWKSTTASVLPGQSQDHGRQFQPYRVLGLSPSPLITSSQSPPPVSQGTGQKETNTLVTNSSLSGEYIALIVQVTKDLVPIVCSEWMLNVAGFAFGVADVKMDQTKSFSKSLGKDLENVTLNVESSAEEWYALMNNSIATLEDVLAILPKTFGVNLELRYTSPHDSSQLSTSNLLESNDFVDAILQQVYTSLHQKSRQLTFSAFDPQIVTSINWKQPNYGCFFSSYCGLSRSSKLTGEMIGADEVEEDDKRCTSVREAVKFAKVNNLLGVMLEATLIAHVPHLIYSVKEAGLILTTFGKEEDIRAIQAGHGVEGVPAVDACLVKGVITYSSDSLSQQ